MIFQSLEDSPAKEVGKRNFDNTTSQKMDDSVLGIDGHLSDSKRQKRLDYEQIDIDEKTNSHCQPVQQAQNLETSHCQSGSKNGAAVVGVDLLVTSDDLYGNRAICEFCQSSRVSDVSYNLVLLDSSFYY